MTSPTQYNIPIEKFIFDKEQLYINASFWEKNGWLKPKKGDEIAVIGKTRIIRYVFSSDAGSQGVYLIFRPKEYFERQYETLAQTDRILTTSMLRIEMNK
jgi:hypothetical protein